jgi:UDP-N-acetylglucosamine enolpyruvyl transferase
MQVNPAKHPNVKRDLGQQFIDLLVLAEGQNAITGYQINGQQLFYPNANDPKARFALPDAALSKLTASCTKVLLGSETKLPWLSAAKSTTEQKVKLVPGVDI